MTISGCEIAETGIQKKKKEIKEPISHVEVYVGKDLFVA